ncbi:hypothetical protein F2Q69_00021804 [Brassica cretica]|uniref:RNase H type-1 domain-containing protein n=1 Tax=Brassica cretica TaxID=69181 RepID=A0A8S9Q1A6_BRACR|nr:hypothetical protein F2Q69_00021804 [Brassica cretica]
MEAKQSQPEEVATRSLALAREWNQAQTKKVKLALVFSGSSEPLLKQCSMVQDFVDSPLLAQALVVRESLRMADAQEISHLQIFSDNSTLIGSVNKKTHRKDLTGIIKDIHSLSSVFVLILFLHIPHKKIQGADALEKSVLRNSLVL